MSKVAFEVKQTTPKRNGWTRFGIDLPFKMVKYKKLGSVTSRERERERERERLCSTEVEFLNLYKLGTNAPTFLGIMLRNNDILLELMPYIYRCNDFYSIFYDPES